MSSSMLVTCLLVGLPVALALVAACSPSGSTPPRTCSTRGCRQPTPRASWPARSAVRRQAHRYVQRAGRSGHVAVPAPAAVFTVKLPVPLIARVRTHAAASGRTLSGVVAQALEEFLARAHREHPRR